MSPYCKKIFSYDLHMSTNFRLLQFDQFHPILYNKISLDTHAKLGLHIAFFLKSLMASCPSCPLPRDETKKKMVPNAKAVHFNRSKEQNKT